MSSTELTVYERIGDPMAAVEMLGTAIAKSRMFGCESIEQGKVFALECLARRVPPLSLAERYDVIQGKLSMKASAMLAGFNESGGKHKIIEYSPEACAVEFDYQKQKLTIRITWEDAQKEKWPYGKEGKIKDNWATPLGKQDMLWARVVSRGVARLLPSVNCGRYTPEEIGDSEPHESSNGSHKAKPAARVESAKAAAAPAPQPAAGEIVDAEYEVTPDAAGEPAPFDSPESPTAPGAPNYCTAEHRLAINTLFGELGLTDEQRQSVINKRGVKMLREFTVEQADELIGKLREKAAATIAANLAGESTADSSAHQAYTWQPASEPLVAEVKSLLMNCGDPAIIDHVRKQLAASGKAKVSELSHRDAEILRDGLMVKQMEAFFAKSLDAPPKNE